MVLGELGEVLNRRARGSPWTRAPARSGLSLQRTGGCGSESGVLLDVFHVQRREEEERGSIQRACACEAKDWGLRASGARARAAT